MLVKATSWRCGGGTLAVPGSWWRKASRHLRCKPSRRLAGRLFHAGHRNRRAGHLNDHHAVRVPK